MNNFRTYLINAVLMEGPKSICYILTCLVDCPAVAIQVSLLGEDLSAHLAGGRLVDLQVEVDLLDVSVECACLGEYLAAVGAHHAVNVVLLADVLRQVGDVLLLHD